jgi:PAS domain-containing protein
MDDAVGYASLGIERVLLDVLDALPVYIMLVDEDHTIQLANAAVRNHTKLEPQEIVGCHCPECVHGSLTPYVGCPLEESVETGQAVEREFYDEEQKLWVSSCIYPTRYRTKDGKRLYFHWIQDISARKKVESEREEYRSRLEQALTKLLSGYIPICASCKKIRDEEESWRSVEDHVTERTGAVFSHGLCPDCAATLYPTVKKSE